MTLRRSGFVIAMLGGWVAYAARSDGEAEIRVKLLNEWTGEPLPRQTVILFEAKGEVGSPVSEQDVVKELRAQTGSDGVARYTLSMPLPSRLLLYLGPLRACLQKGATSTPGQYRPEEVIKSGIIIPGTCVPRNWHGKFRWQDVRAQPGEVVVFASPPPRAQW